MWNGVPLGEVKIRDGPTPFSLGRSGWSVCYARHFRPPLAALENARDRSEVVWFAVGQVSGCRPKVGNIHVKHFSCLIQSQLQHLPPETLVLWDHSWCISLLSFLPIHFFFSLNFPLWVGTLAIHRVTWCSYTPGRREEGWLRIWRGPWAVDQVLLFPLDSSWREHDTGLTSMP